MKDDGGVLIFLLIGWFVASLLVGTLGSSRKIGFGGTFLISLLLSPLLGAIFALASDKIVRDPRTAISPQTEELITSATKKYMDKDYEGAIETLHQALRLSPFSPRVHFYLAQAYSHTRNRAETFKHFKLAVEQGFTDFASLNTLPDFEFLRSLPEFQEYARNGYKSVSPNTSEDDTVSKLERLGNLKKEGFVTEEEFELQKRKILDS
jgi:tetratricopeptide (TPR) repeat protein